MALTIEVTDNLDGTLTAALTGHASGDDLTWYATKLTDQFVSGAWATIASTTNATAGTHTFANQTPAAGYGVYFSYARNLTNGDVAPPWFHGYHDPDDSVFEQCLVAVQARIVALNLTSIDSDDIKVRKLPWNRAMLSAPGPSPAGPSIVVTPITETMDFRQGTNYRDDVGYGCLVTIIQPSNQDLTTNRDRMLGWRQQIARAFRNQRLPGVSEVITCAVEPGATFLPAAFELQYDVAAMVVRCLSREPRGTS